jgi:hypothetical protein
LALMKYQKLHKKNLIEMLNDTGVRSEFSYFSEEQFWFWSLFVYPTIAETVLKILLPWPATYVCEVGYSSFLKC